MSPEAAHDLSLQDFLHALNEKINLEWTRIRDLSPSCAVSTAELESEVSTRHRFSLRWTRRWGLTPAGCIDRKSRNQRTRCSEVHPLFTEHTTAGQQIASRDPLPCRRMLPRPRGARLQRKSDRSTDSRVPILARVHHLCPRELDTGIPLLQEAGCVDPGAVQGGTSAPLCPRTLGCRSRGYVL